MTYRITNRGETTEVLFYEDIGDGWFGGVTAKQVKADLAKIDTPKIDARFNSPGGSVHEGFAIANALKDHPAEVTARIDALAASIASYIAIVGADEVVIAQNGMVMIHNAATIALGDAAELRRTADILDKHNDILIAAYVEKTGQKEDSIRAAMDAETWYTADEAIEAGLADSVAAEVDMAAAYFTKDRFRNAPAALAARMAEDPQYQSETPWRRLAAQRRLLTKGSG